MNLNSPKIMGVLNMTPDSFSDGGKYNAYPEDRIAQLMRDGADIIDIGGESTGPNSKNVSLEEEGHRVKSAIDYAARSKLVDKIPFSIDTYKGPVGAAALKAGADMVNDIWGFKYDPTLADPNIITERQFVIALPGAVVSLSIHGTREFAATPLLQEVRNAVPYLVGRVGSVP